MEKENPRRDRLRSAIAGFFSAAGRQLSAAHWRYSFFSFGVSPPGAMDSGFGSTFSATGSAFSLRFHSSAVFFAFAPAFSACTSFSLALSIASRASLAAATAFRSLLSSFFLRSAISESSFAVASFGTASPSADGCFWEMIRRFAPSMFARMPVDSYCFATRSRSLACASLSVFSPSTFRRSASMRCVVSSSARVRYFFRARYWSSRSFDSATAIAIESMLC